MQEPEAFKRRQIAQWGPRFFVVSAAGGAIGDIPIYRSIEDITERVDLAVLRVRAPLVADVVRACGRAGIRNAVVYTSGFSEVGADGAALERELQLACRESGVR